MRSVWLVAMGLALFALSSGGARAGGEAAAADEASDYLGGERCAGCHQKQAERWAAGPHARAGASLGTQAGRSRCERCHGTEQRRGLALLRNVQCEACHGPGRGYAAEDLMRSSHLARALGLRVPRSDEELVSLCRRCHVGRTQLVPFEPLEAWARIGH